MSEEALGSAFSWRGGDARFRAFSQAHAGIELLGRPSRQQSAIFLLHFRDITERLQADAARRHSEEQLRLLIDAVKDHAIDRLDVKGRIASWKCRRSATLRLLSPRGPREAHFHLLVGLRMRKLAWSRCAAEEGGEARQRSGGRLAGPKRRLQVSRECWTHSAIYNDLGSRAGSPSWRVTSPSLDRRRSNPRTANAGCALRSSSADRGPGGGRQRGAIDCESPVPGVVWFAVRPRQPTVADFISVVSADDRRSLCRGGIDEPWRPRVARDSCASFASRGETGERHGLRVLAAGFSAKRRTPNTHYELFGVVFDADQKRHHQMDEFRGFALGRMIAHDLRSPLSVIKAVGVSCCSNAEPLPETMAQKYRGHPGGGGQNGAHGRAPPALTTQAEFGGEIPLHREPTDLEEVCRSALREVQAANPGVKSSSRLEVTVTERGTAPNSSKWPAISSRTRSSTGQPEQPVYVVARDEGDQVEPNHNLGPPIPTDLLPANSEPFRRGEQRSSGKAGFGLGLYIAKEIVAAHGGTIEVRSLDASGTTFTVRLPRGVADYAAPIAGA